MGKIVHSSYGQGGIEVNPVLLSGIKGMPRLLLIATQFYPVTEKLSAF